MAGVEATRPRRAPSAGPRNPDVGLRRTLSLPMITFYGLGNILGAGIYVLIGKVVGYAGVLAPLAFVLASLLAGLTAFTYAELSARYPLSAGEAVYVEQGLGRRWLAATVGLLIVFAGIVSSATILRGFVGYLQVFVAVDESAALVVLATLLGALAAWGISQSVAVAAAFALLGIAGLAMIVTVGVPALPSPGELLPATARLAEPGAASGVMLAAFLAFFAFIGFEDMVNVAEEVRDPQRNLPRAILLSLLVATLLYLMVALIAVNSVARDVLAASDAPLALIYQTLSGRDPIAITIIGMLAVVNGALIQIIMASRMMFGMARRRWLPEVLGRVHPRTRTPLPATLIIAAGVLLLALWGTTEALAKATSYALLLVFALSNLALWRLKRRAAQPHGIIDVPRWVPALGCVASLAFVGFQAIGEFIA